jgi:hypothetical protein
VQARSIAIRHSWFLGVLILFASLGACSKTPPGVSPPTPVNFPLALQYAQRAELAYEQDTTITQRSGPDVTVAISPPVALGVKAYVETDDDARVQWIVVRGTSNLANIRSNVDYNKAVESRLQVPLHKGFSDAALQVYQFAKPLLKKDYETRISGHSLGGAAAVIVLMLLKEDGYKLGQAMTFGQPKVTNREGARKYGGLPLLRFVNAKDPVPLLPPFEVFAVLDEGPFRHFGAEVVLEQEAGYRYYPEHQAGIQSVLSFWNNLKNISVNDVPEHFMSTYLARIQQNVSMPGR